MIFDIFKTHNECKHNNIPVDAEEAYCPDCGELVRNKWYLVRCSCCNIKRKSHTEFGKIKPDTRFCPNCGGSEFYITELDKVLFTDLHYAVLKREIVKQGSETINQIWVEAEDEITDKKLIGIRVD